MHEGTHPPGKRWAQFPAKANIKHQPGVACDEPPKFGRRHVILSQEDFDIAPDVMEARLPSLLLQPIIENAIKYAVTPAEDGADILVDARRMGDRLVITIADTGPGLGAEPGATGGRFGLGFT